MAWYSEADYPSIPDHSRSFVVALANLIKYTQEVDVAPPELVTESPLDLHSFSEHETIVFKEALHDNENTWPTSGACIVKFIRTDIETGARTGHYCYVLDNADKIIVDSLDGQLKSGESYGHVYTWASFIHRDPEPETHKWKKDSFHLWHRGDSLVDIARDMGVPYKTLLRFNDIESYTELEDGIPIYYPAPPDSKERKITIDVQDPVLYMHVAKPGGAKKWMFGSMESFNDALPNGFFPEKTNVRIAAIAKVPVKDEDGTDAEAAYYLDANALGDYKTTGILRYTLGFAWSDLDHGHVETMISRTAPSAPAVELPPYLLDDVTENADSDTQTETSIADDTQAEVPETPPARFSKEYIDEILSSYQRLAEPLMCIVDLSEVEEKEYDSQTDKHFVWVKDFAGKRQDLPMYNNFDIEIGATFMSDGIIYGQPIEAMEGNIFFGIPMAILQSHADFLSYNKPVDATTRYQSGGQLTWSERYIWVPGVAFLTKFAPKYLKKIKKEKI